MKASFLKRLAVVGALAPLTIAPAFAQEAYLKASNTGARDNFGCALAMSGHTLIVGAGLEDSSATGVNGNGSDNSAPEAGAAYVFMRGLAGSWTQQAYLKASTVNVHHNFGRWSVAIAGDTAVVGADGAEAAYVFVRGGTNWSEQACLKSGAAGVNLFGHTVAVSGDTIVVGAMYADNLSGAAYVFTRSGTNWAQQACLKASNAGVGDRFGWSLAMAGDTVVVGAVEEASNATGVNGDGNNNSAGNAGAAYVFVRTGTNWSQQAYLKASNTEAGDQFGHAVGVSGDTVVVATSREASSSTGINGDQNNNGAPFAGAAYVFARSGTTWTQQAYLKAHNAEQGDRFGFAVATTGEMVVVGGSEEDSSATGINGDGGDNSANAAGAAYVFRRSGATWTQQSYLKASNAGGDDNFGYAVAAAGDTVVVGALNEASNATGVNGNGSDNSAFGAGAAYPFLVLPPPPLSLVCASNKTVDCVGPSPDAPCPWDFDAPTIAGGCSGTNVTLTVVSTLTNRLCPMLVTRTWRATDACNDSVTCNQTVTVVSATPPVLDCRCLTNLAHNLLFTNGCPAYVPDLCQFTNCFSDECCLPTNACMQTPAAGTPVGPGTHPINIKLTDCANNMTNCTVNFVVTCPPTNCLTVSDEQVTCVPTVPGKLNYSFTFKNNTGVPVKYLFLVPNNPCFTFMPDIFTFSVPVSPGQTATISTMIKVTANCPANLCFLMAAHTSNLVQCCSITHCVTIPSLPVIVCPDVTVDCQEDSGAYVNYAMPTASSPCCPGPVPPSVTCSPPPGWFPIGVTPVTCTAVDACGFTNRCAFSVIVKGYGSGMWTWARQAASAIGTNATPTLGNGVAVDGQGNVFVAGFYQGTMAFPSGPSLSAFGGNDIFLAKYNSAGALLWAVRAGGSGADNGLELAVDAAGNAYVTGDFTGTATFGPFTLTSAGGTDIFVAKYDPGGACLWAVRNGVAGNDTGFSVAVAGNGSVFVTGNWAVSVVQPFLMKLDGNSGAILNTAVGSSIPGEIAQGRAVAVDGAGDAYLVVTYVSPAAFTPFPGCTLPGAGINARAYILKFNGTTMGCLWAAHSSGVGATGNHDSTGIAVDPSGAFCYVTAYFNGTANFGGPASVTNGKNVIGGGQLYDYLVAKLNAATGVPVWAIQGGGNPASDDETRGIAVDADGNPCVTGFLRPNAPAPSVNDAPTLLVASYSPAGALRWTRNATDAAGPPNSPANRSLSIAVDRAGCVHVTGTFTEDLTFPPVNLPVATLIGPPGNVRKLFVGKLCPKCGCDNLDHNLSTGLNNSTGTPAPFGANDDCWVITGKPPGAGGGTPPFPAVVVPAVWGPPLPGSRWISVSSGIGPAVIGFYTNRYCFWLDQDFQNAALNLSMRADDQVAGVTLNGNSICSGCPGGNFGGAPLQVTTANQSFFVAGQNCLEIIVQDTFASAVGLNVAGTVTAVKGACCSRLCGMKFNDLNGNGVKDTGEPSLSGWTILVRDATLNVVASVVTGAGGSYCIKVPAPATYTVEEVPQANWVKTLPATPAYAVAVTGPQTYGGLDFGNVNCVTTPVLNLLSGANNTGLLPANALDPQFSTGLPLFTTPNPYVIAGGYPGWLANGPLSQWVGPDPSPAGKPANAYVYTNHFFLCSTSQAVITGRWAADNDGEIRLNGSATGNTLPVTLGFVNWSPVSITSGFVPGWNALTFHVTNYDGPTGLRTELTGTAWCQPCLDIHCPPNVTANTCGGPVPVFYPAPTATSSCITMPFLSCVPPAGSLFWPGVTTVYCTASDAQGHTAGCSFTVTVLPELPQNCFRLTIGVVRTNIVLSWSTAFPNAVLEATTTLNPPRVWLPVNAPVTVIGQLNVVTLPIAGPQRFFRLSAPAAPVGN